MSIHVRPLSLLALSLASALAHAADEPAAKHPSMADVIAASKPSDWRAIDPQNLLYVDFAGRSRVVIELAPAFAPKHVENIRALAREGWFDGLALVREQDNYVAQWGDPNGDDAAKAKKVKNAKATLDGEFARSDKDLAFTPLPDGDVYAPAVGFSGGFPVARDAKAGKAWLTHCYGMVGAGRGDTADSGNGGELYVVIGHSPRHLDRNVTLVGRVVQGVDQLSSFPRGTGALGFYEKPEQRTALTRARLAADVPANERVDLEALRTDTDTFKALVESRRTRHESWFLEATGKIELCNVPLVVREKKVPDTKK
jgi:peptidylprolyl isomerase